MLRSSISLPWLMIISFSWFFLPLLPSQITTQCYCHSLMIRLRFGDYYFYCFVLQFFSIGLYFFMYQLSIGLDLLLFLKGAYAFNPCLYPQSHENIHCFSPQKIFLKINISKEEKYNELNFTAEKIQWTVVSENSIFCYCIIFVDLLSYAHAF